MRIAIASDHAAVALKTDLVEWLTDEGHEVNDLGPQGIESVDYPDYGYKLAEEIAGGRAERGIALCGTGIGISIACNRHPACRCARVSEPLSAQLARDIMTPMCRFGRALIGSKAKAARGFSPRLRGTAIPDGSRSSPTPISARKRMRAARARPAGWLFHRDGFAPRNGARRRSRRRARPAAGNSELIASENTSAPFRGEGRAHQQIAEAIRGRYY